MDEVHGNRIMTGNEVAQGIPGCDSNFKSKTGGRIPLHESM